MIVLISALEYLLCLVEMHFNIQSSEVADKEEFLSN